MSKLKCPICDALLLGRTDKKYCSDQCRYIANNKHKIKNEYLILDINKRLRKNRAILKKLCPAGKAVIRKEMLDAMGYDVTVFSSLFFLTSNKQLYYICYDYAFMPLIEHNVAKALIVTTQEYMNLWNPWKYVKTYS